MSFRIYFMITFVPTAVETSNTAFSSIWDYDYKETRFLRGAAV